MATALHDESAKLGVVRTREIVPLHLLVWLVEGKNVRKAARIFLRDRKEDGENGKTRIRHSHVTTYILEIHQNQNQILVPFQC